MLGLTSVRRRRSDVNELYGNRFSLASAGHTEFEWQGILAAIGR